MKQKITIFWMRRDLRLKDNRALYEALSSNQNVLPLFIFDPDILSEFKNPNDRRVLFVLSELKSIKAFLNEVGSDLLIALGKPLEIYKTISQKYYIEKVYCNHDYEPKTIQRDLEVSLYLQSIGSILLSFKDQVIFEKNEILTDSEKPYLVFTAYKNKWLKEFKKNKNSSQCYRSESKVFIQNFYKGKCKLKLFDFEKFRYRSTDKIVYPEKKIFLSKIKKYHKERDFPFLDGTTHLGLHLRFGTVSIRKLVAIAVEHNMTWLSELIWREFFMQILFHFPKSENFCFKADYESIQWRENKSEARRWEAGETGFPIIDAGVRELLATGTMHNRVRMSVASFFTKNMLHHWKQGERFFAQHLLDFELASNVGNWQWVAGTGCDAAPYFRVFNPETQQKKFDPDFHYIKKWIPEFGTSRYAKPMLDLRVSRINCLLAYSKALKKSESL